MKQRTIVILGGAQAGPTAAARAREVDEHARIVLLERSNDISYAVGGLAYHLSGEVPSLAALNRERAEFFRDVYRVEAKTGVEASSINAKKRRIDANGERFDYDALVFALGAHSELPEIAGLEGAKNVFRLRTLADLSGIDERLARGKRRVAVIGGGFFGVEAADGLSRARAEVALIEHGPRILGQFSPWVSAMAAEALAALGARVMTATAIKRVERAGDDVDALELEPGGRVAVDLVIVTTGLSPRTELLAEAGAALYRDGTLRVDSRLRTSLERIHACGVCVSLPHAVSEEPVWIAQSAIADKTAQVAGANAAGAKLRMPPVLGTAIIRAGALTCARTGLSAAEIKKRDLNVSRVHAPSHDPFFPGSNPVSIELRYHEKTGRILGADIAGKVGIDKRIDVVATAIQGGLGIDDLALLDLAYAPPYSAARDPVNVAATVAANTRASGMRSVSARELAKQGQRVVIVDVRSGAGSGPLAGALAIPLAALRDRLSELPENGRIVFVDELGRDAYLAARIAAQAGIERVGYLSGGLASLRLERAANGQASQ